MSYACLNYGTFVFDPCVRERGRVGGVAFKKACYTFADITDPNEWDTAIASGDVLLLLNVRGDKPKASTTAIPGYGRQKDINIVKDFTLNYKQAEVTDDANADFYNDLFFSNDLEIIYVTETKLWLNSGVVRIDVDTVVQEAIETIVEWDVTVTWQSQEVGIPYDIPTGVFAVVCG
jgi:hypothetical protein